MPGSCPSSLPGFLSDFRLIFATAIMLLTGCGGGLAPADSTESPTVQREGSTTVIGHDEPVKRGTAALRLMPDSRADQTGAFGSLMSWPLVPIHAALLPDGRVMSFGRDADAAAQMVYDIWDPSQADTDSAHLTLPNQTGTDLFCSNQMLLDNGIVLMAGGDLRSGAQASIGAQQLRGNRDANAFDPNTNTLTRVGQLNEPRWYASLTKLSTGEVFIQGGAVDMALNLGAVNAELASQNGRLYQSLSGFTLDDLPWYYPRNFVDASGQIVGWAHNRSYRIDPRGMGTRTDTGAAPGVTLNNASLAVMYAPGKVLLAGGGANTAVRVDIDGHLPAYEPVPPMDSPRIWGTATVLPDGRVLVSGGSDIDTSVLDAGLGKPAMHVALYDPALNQWTTGPKTARVRLYHSTALLLPDASVLIGGGGLPGPVTNQNAEIYYPAYLFDQHGEFARRPVIRSAPTVLEPTAPFIVVAETADQVSRLALVKSGAVTHGFDMDQRLIALPFEQNGRELSTSLPTPASRTPPGFYRLFVFDEHGVPSHGHPVRINSSKTYPDPVFEPTVAGLTAIGEHSSQALALVCGPGERLVGVHGGSASWLTGIGPLCESERIIRRSMFGPDQSGQWSRQCPAGSTVTALIGQTTGAKDRITTLDLECNSQPIATGTQDAVFGSADATAARAECPPHASATGLRILADDAGIRGLALTCRR